MEFRFSAEWATPTLASPSGLLEAGLCLILALSIAFAAWKTFRSLKSFGLVSLLMTVGAMAGGSLLAGSCWLLPQEPRLRWAMGSQLPVAGLLPMVLAGWLLGPIPAGLTGLAVGFVTAGQANHSLVSVLAACLAGLSLGILLHQDHQGAAFAWLRRPAVATTLVSILLWPIPIWRSLAAPLILGQVGGWQTQAQHLLWLLLPSLLAGLPSEALYLLVPSSRAVQRPVRPAPYQRSLARRLVAGLIPLLLLLAFGGAYAANFMAAQAAVHEVESSLPLIAEGVQRELEWTRRAAESTLTQMAVELSTEGPNSLKSSGLFAAIWVADPSGALASDQPLPSNIQAPPSDLLERLIRDPTQWTWTEDGHLLIQAPVGGPSPTYLVAAIPATDCIRAALPTRPTGHPQCAYFARPEGSALMSAWLFSSSEAGPSEVNFSDPRHDEPRPGRFLTAEGNLVLTTSVASQGLEFGAVLSPQTLIATAMPTSMPLLLVLVLGALLAAIAYPTMVAETLRPLTQLAQTAGRIARGHWGVNAEIASSDEIGRLSLAIEEMRRALQIRGQQIALLAELAEAPPGQNRPKQDLARLLRGLLRSTDANAAAIVLYRETKGQPTMIREQQPGASIPTEAWMQGLAAELTTSHAPLFCEKLLQSPHPDRFAEPLALGIQALVALPLALDGEYLGMLYLQYPAPQSLSQMERGLLQALARQATLLISHVEATLRARQAEHQLKALLEASMDPALVISAEGELLAGNQAGAQAFNLEIESLRGKSLTADQVGEGLHRFLTRLSMPNPPLAGEVATRPHRTFAVRAAPFGQQGQGPTGWVLTARDLSDLKRLDAMKGEFVSAFSHDLKAPLKHLRSLVTVIPMIGELNLKQKELVEHCVEEIDSISALIEGIVELAKLESLPRLRLTSCQLPSLLTQVLEAHRAAAREKRLRVHLEVGSQPPPILADREWVQVAMGHLLENAIQYTPSGGQIAITLTEAEGQVVLRVRDTGMGIPADEQHRVFERFYRGRQAVAAGIPGNGLGLSVVRAVATAHGGRVWIESAPGLGTSVHLAFPKEAHLSGLAEGKTREKATPLLPARS